MGTLIFLKRIKDKFDNESRKTVVQSLAISVMNYCLTIYGTTNNTHLHRVQKLQNFAAKSVSGERGKAITPLPVSHSSSGSKLKKNLYLMWLLMFSRKITKCFLIDIYIFPQWMKHNTKSHTRQHEKLYVSYTNTDCGARSLTELGPTTWNSLPYHATQTRT